MDKKTWIIFAVVVVGFLAALVYFSGGDKIDVANIDENSVLEASEQSGNIADRTYGKADSKVILLEYGDFQCPGCGSAHPNIKQVTEKYKDELAFVFRNFPLSSIHPNARAAAAATEAAGLQGRYWEFHNRIFESQDSWNTLGGAERINYFTDLATQIGVSDINKFKQDIDGDVVKQKVNFDLALGKKVGVTGTPSFYLNGTVIEQETWSDVAKLDAAIVAELKKQGIEVSAE